MSDSNFTPISSKTSQKKKSSSIFKVLGLLTIFVTFIGIGVGYVMVQQGFNFRPKATSASRNLAKYGWNGSCFTALSTIRYGARYQCPGKISNYANGCQGGVSKRTGNWQYNSTTHPLTTNGKSNVCIVPNGSDGPKDSNGCFTQQLDVDSGNAGSPEGFYSFDNCGPTTPANPKQPAITTCEGGFYCNGSPVVGSTIGQVVCGGGDASWSGYNWQCGTDGKWFPLHTTCNMCVAIPTPTPTPTVPDIPVPTPVVTEVPTPTPTVPACVGPSTPTNVHINCPLCSQSSTQ